MEMTRRRLRLTDINEHLICMLCGGYFVDATTIVECLHSFCRSCLIKYLENNSYCPICEVQIHKAKPFLNIKPDEALQDIVYKLVPGLFHSEMRRRREFYAKHPYQMALTTPEERGVTVERIVFSPDESISLSLEYLDQEREIEEWESVSSRSSASGADNCEVAAYSKRYLLCPALVTVGHLKKFLRLKYDLQPDHVVELIHRRECLSDEYTLMDIAYIYTWKRNSPMRFFYRIYKPEDVTEDHGGSEEESSPLTNYEEKQSKKLPAQQKANKSESESCKSQSNSKQLLEASNRSSPELQLKTPSVDLKLADETKQTQVKVSPACQKTEKLPRVLDGNCTANNDGGDSQNARPIPSVKMETDCDVGSSSTSEEPRANMVSPVKPLVDVLKPSDIIEKLLAAKEVASSTTCVNTDTKTSSSTGTTKCEEDKSVTCADTTVKQTCVSEPVSTVSPAVTVKPVPQVTVSTSSAPAPRAIGTKSAPETDDSKSKCQPMHKVAPCTNCVKQVCPASSSETNGDKKESPHSKLSHLLNNHQQILKKNDEIAASSESSLLVKRQLSINVNETLRRKLLQHSEKNNLKQTSQQVQEKCDPGNDKCSAKKRRVNNHLKDGTNGVARSGLFNFTVHATVADKSKPTSLSTTTKRLHENANEANATEGTKQEENGQPYVKIPKRDKRSPTSESQQTSVSVPPSRSLLLSSMVRCKPQSNIAAEIAARGISVTSIPVSSARLDTLSSNAVSISCNTAKKEPPSNVPNTADTSASASPSPHREKMFNSIESLTNKPEMLKISHVVRDSVAKKNDYNAFISPAVPKEDSKKNCTSPQRQMATPFQQRPPTVASTATNSKPCSSSQPGNLPRLIEIHSPAALKVSAEKRPPRTPTPALGKTNPSRDCIGALDLSASPRRPATILSIAQTLARRRQQAASTPPPQLRIPVPPGGGRQPRPSSASAPPPPPPSPSAPAQEATLRQRMPHHVFAQTRVMRPPPEAAAAALIFHQQLELQRLWRPSTTDWYSDAASTKRLEHFMKSLGRGGVPGAATSFFPYNSNNSSNSSSNGSSNSNSTSSQKKP